MTKIRNWSNGAEEIQQNSYFSGLLIKKFLYSDNADFSSPINSNIQDLIDCMLGAWAVFETSINLKKTQVQHSNPMNRRLKLKTT